MNFKPLGYFLFLLVALTSLASNAATELESVTMQVRWKHQFQFAGYYAALEKGFYKEQGLNVTIEAGSPSRTPVNEVMTGRAHYGEANSELLYHYLHGEPLVALAAIFQHSPSVLLTLKDKGIYTPQRLVNKRIMMVGGTEDTDFLAMLANEAVPIDMVTILPSSYNIQDLIDGKTDAFNAYLTNEPFYLKERGVEGYVIKPINYGVDFYSDVLFTSEQEIKQHPERVKKFLKASLAGWEYAMQHPQEIIDLIIKKYQPDKSRAHVEYEAETMQELILPNLIPIGNINPGRFQRMADILVQFGLAEPNYSLDNFIYEPDPQVNRTVFIKSLILTGSVTLIVAVIAIILWQFNSRYRHEIQLRKQVEAQLSEMAFYDKLTGLPNRTLLLERLELSISMAERHHHFIAVAYLDLDGFKVINDSYGHDIGDQFLIEISRQLKESLRDIDTLARFGGDEFVAIITDLHNKQEIEQILQRLLQASNAHITIDGHNLKCSASIGVSFYQHGDKSDTTQLIRQADHAMYDAKTSGKNNIVYFQEQ